MKDILIEHLNNMYCAQSHLVKHWNEISEHADFADVRANLLHIVKKTKCSMLQMDILFNYFHAESPRRQCSTLLTSLEGSMEKIRLNSHSWQARNHYLFLYLQITKNIHESTAYLLQFTPVSNSQERDFLYRDSHDLYLFSEPHFWALFKLAFSKTRVLQLNTERT